MSFIKIDFSDHDAGRHRSTQCTRQNKHTFHLNKNQIDFDFP